MNVQRILLILVSAICFAGATAEAGLLSPEAVMYGMSPAEAHRMRLFAAELQMEGGMGSALPDGDRDGRSPDRKQRGRVEAENGSPTATAQLPQDGTGSAGGAPSDGPQGPSQSAIADNLEVTRAILVAYLWRESRLLIHVPYLDGIFRPPRNHS